MFNNGKIYCEQCCTVRTIYVQFNLYFMYKVTQKQCTNNVASSDCIERFERSPYYPFSYYVLGGSDVVGDHLANTAEVSYDSPDVLNDPNASPIFSNDPRANALDVAEVLGTMDVEDIANKKPDDDKDE